MMEQIKKLIIPVTAILVLVIGNFYQGMSREELLVLEDLILALGTAILGIIGVFAVAKKDKSDKNK